MRVGGSASRTAGPRPHRRSWPARARARTAGLGGSANHCGVVAVVDVVAGAVLDPVEVVVVEVVLGVVEVVVVVVVGVVVVLLVEVDGVVVDVDVEVEVEEVTVEVVCAGVVDPIDLLGS